jgi:hypothetical protein
MTKSIKEIPYLGVLLDCFPELSEEVQQWLESESEEEITDEQWFAIARWWRNALLTESDWSQIPDNSLNSSQRNEWIVYRQQLRDLPGNYSNPQEIVFPDLPS